MSYWDHAKPVQRTRAVHVEQIAKEACQLLDRDGFDAFTLRAVANRLCVAPASLYSRIRSLDDILDIALDYALSVDDGLQKAMANDAGCEELFLAYYRHLLTHPWTIGVIARRPPRGPAYISFSEAVCARLVRDGVDEPLARSYALSNYVLGCAMTARVAGLEPNAPVRDGQAPVYESLRANQSFSTEDVVNGGVRALLHFSIPVSSISGTTKPEEVKDSR